MEAPDERLGVSFGANREIPSSIDMLIDFCVAQEAYVSRNIQLADAKAGVTLVAASGVLGFMLKEPAFKYSLHGVLSGMNWSTATAGAAFLLLALASAVAYWVIIPRTGLNLRSPSGVQQPPSAGVVFWGDIAAFPESDAKRDYPNSVSSLSPASMAKALLTNVYQISCICTRKMRLLRWAMTFAAAAFLVACGWEIIFS